MPRDPDVEYLTTAVGKRLAAQHSNPNSWLSRLLIAHSPDGTVLRKGEGTDRARGLVEAAEKEMVRILRGKDGLLIYHGLRSLSRRMWITDSYDPAGADARKIAEMAVQKYASWQPPSQDPRIRRFRFSRRDVHLVADILLLAESHLEGMVLVRRVSKGQVLIVDDALGGTFRPQSKRDDDLGRLMEIRDRRSMMSSDGLSNLGMHSRGNTGSRASVLVAEWRPVAELERDFLKDIDSPVQVALGKYCPAHDVLARWAWRSSISEMVEAVAPLESDLRARYGCGLPDVIAVLDQLSLRVDPLSPEASEMLCRRGYWFAEWPSDDEQADVVEYAKSRRLEGAKDVSSTGIAAAFDVVSVKPELLSLYDPTYRRPIVRLGRYFMYDALGCHLPSFLTHPLQVEESRRQRVTKAFERQVHMRLSEWGGQPFDSGHSIEMGGRRLTDLDASVVWNDILVAVDCYSSPWTAVLDRGEYQAVRNRLSTVLEKYHAWQNKWQTLTTESPSLLLEHGIRAVLPVVVTSSAEWLDRTCRRYWFDEETPRICTAEELVKVLEYTTATDIGGLLTFD